MPPGEGCTVRLLQGRDSAGFAAQLATRDDDDVRQRRSAEKREDRCKDSLVCHDRERRAGQPTYDEAVAGADTS